MSPERRKQLAAVVIILALVAIGFGIAKATGERASIVLIVVGIATVALGGTTLLFGRHRK
ncbi:LPXTG cell wall anchor domain-containing protein [Streptomyces sp. V4I2]|uniref:LPXTG cell wall anchor domain-containing protein n=1 Tax=Streptomyces sp. V4I2 TaxID=3042280 RepID=UPI0035946512